MQQKKIPALFDKIEQLINDIKNKNKHMQIGIDRDRGGMAITLKYNKYSLHLEWIGRFGNTLDDSYLDLSLWILPSLFRNETIQTKVLNHKYSFDISLSNEFGWQDNSSNKYLNSDQSAEFFVETILDKIKSLN